ncbi:MAG: LysM peptidoglycan-binding domain-containing protein [Deltaproteobacteria bacterium]|jgi:tetratricopeptide (TPR) repeat protein|nr:LysM peptidoglycan-binding domain-containing protein [Deltaproteobacteria bacterium]
MKIKAGIISVVILLALLAGCAMMGSKSPEALAKDYTAKAQQFEKQGDLVEALKQYKLVLTVDPDNQLARQKIATLEPQMLKLADKHYKEGLKFYNKGQYGPARKEFLTALRYNPEHTKAKTRLASTSKDMGQVKRYIVHTIQPDESISTLAERYYGDYRKFHLIADYNEMEDPTRVKVGQDIKIPVIEGMPIMADPGKIQAEEGASSEELAGDIIAVKRYVMHTVQPEESLSALAMKYYGDYSKFHVIAQFNNLEDGTSVRVGQELKIPEIEGVPFQVEAEAQETEAVTTAKAAPLPETEAQKPEAAATAAKPISPDDQLSHYRELGVELYNNEEYEAAIAEFDKVLNVNPADQTARDYMSLAYREKGRQSLENKAYAKAEKEFETSLIYDPGCPDCQKYIDQVRQMDSDSLRQEAIALYDQKKYKQSIVKFEAIAKTNPDDKQTREYLEKAHFQQGLQLFGKEDYLAARDEFKTALHYNPDCDQCEKNIQKSEDIYKEVHYEKGLTYFGDQKLAEAIQEWESVSAIDPNYKDVNKNLTKAKTLYERLESIKRSKTQQDTQ